MLNPTQPRHIISIFSRPRWLIAGLLFFASLSLYLSTLAPAVVTLFDDSLEFQLVAYRLGIAHPTGYPLFTLLGKLFTLLPLGDIAYRVNLMSAVFGAATVAALYLLILQVIGVEGEASRPYSPLQWTAHLGGLIGALLLAVSQVFWQQATLAEVYTLNALFVGGLLLLATSPASALYALAILAGLSLTHHRTMLLLCPTLALAVYFNHKAYHLTPQRVIISLLLGVLPLLLYLYLPLRGHVGSLDGTYQNTWAGFWRHVSGGGYDVFIFSNPFNQQRDALFYWNLLRDQFYTLAPGVVGLFYLLWVGQRKMLALTGLAFVTYFGFNLFYQVSDIEVFFIPVFALWAVWSGVGAAFLLNIAASTTGNRQPLPFSLLPLWRLALTGLILVIFGFIVMRNLWVNLPGLAQRNTWQAHDYGLDILQQPLDNPPAVVGILGEMTLLRYFQQTENRRPDIETVAADLETDRLVAVEKLLTAGKAVYLTRPLPGAAQRWSLNAVGPLIRVNPQPVNAPPSLPFVLNRPVTPQLTLNGYSLSRPPHTGPGPAPLRLTAFWQITGPLSADLKVSARLLNGTGDVMAVTDVTPVHFAYPTTAWRPGEVVADVYDLSLPTNIPPGQYPLLLIWYDPAQNAAEMGRIELAPVTLP